ncbi:MAG: DUF2807 domain-containing protein [Alphaproteobacteria bacterium]|nr:DUF2807 domain-containing protein [Alphaproteobacteria bacterium]MBU1516155.1 DUF2807 domain-containing protein [Alphaproteobacteria bacterium]MBU2097104.1 DUF2807 domain-containing protein [Alphaproteobacteria bacterium]MBU2152072.1 DUF2807 domain-containing protein [Alphaproteobacteria bacterium]MBU2306291.1 DUF2807 domain-containing protein [Alphaproteobacteria bacterium]
MRLSMAVLAAAAAFSATVAQAATVEIRDAVARVTVVPQDRADVKVEIVRQHPGLPLSVGVAGGRTLIDGGLNRRIRDCNGMGENARVSVRDVGKVAYADMPQVVIYTPRDVDLEASGALVGTIGRSASLELHNAGCANWTVADVAGEAELHQSGAGSVKMGTAGSLDLQLSGAGNLNAVAVRDGMDARLSGAGGVTVGSFGGDLEAQVSGVGQIRIADGRASHVRASVSGIGGVDFGGVAGDLQASISGLGNIRVREVTGSVTKSVSGGGRIRIGNRPS